MKELVDYINTETIHIEIEGYGLIEEENKYKYIIESKSHKYTFETSAKTDWVDTSNLMKVFSKMAEDQNPTHEFRFGYKNKDQYTEIAYGTPASLSKAEKEGYPLEWKL